jgi:hypothetical protein
MFKKKGAPSAKSLDFTWKQDKGQSGDFAHASGQSFVNSKGQVTNKTGQVQNWPYQRFTVDNELNPRSNSGKPSQLSETPQTYGDFTSDGKAGGLNVMPTRQTLG